MFKHDINTPLLTTLATISCLLLIVTLLGTHAYYLYEVDRETKLKWQGITNERVYNLKAAQRSALNAPPHWIDQQKGTASIPIDQAMQLIAQNKGNLPK